MKRRLIQRAAKAHIEKELNIALQRKQEIAVELDLLLHGEEHTARALDIKQAIDRLCRPGRAPGEAGRQAGRVPRADRSGARRSCGSLKEAGLQALLELKIDDDVIVARIKKAGLAFAGDEPAIQRLAEAGASDAVLSAIRAAGAKKPPSSGATAIT